MKIVKKILPKVFLFENKSTYDARGKFIKIKNLKNFNYNQLCLSFNKKKGTLRGIHYQKKPLEEEKILTCVIGSVFEVIVNCNKKSRDYLKYKTIILNSNQKNSLYIGKGYASGFQTLEKNTILMYNINGKFKKNLQTGILWNDPCINIKWPLRVTKISGRDKRFKPLKENPKDKQ